MRAHDRPAARALQRAGGVLALGARRAAAGSHAASPSCRFEGETVLVKLEGVDSPEAARALRRAAAGSGAGPRCCRPRRGDFYPWQMEGAAVETRDGRGRGPLRRVESGGAQELWVVERRRARASHPGGAGDRGGGQRGGAPDRDRPAGRAAGAVRIDIVTLFPGMVEGPLPESMLGRAQARGLVDIRVLDLRDYTGGGTGSRTTSRSAAAAAWCSSPSRCPAR